MHIEKFAIVLVRLVGLQFLLAALLYLTYPPERTMMVNHVHSVAGIEYANLELHLAVVRLALHIILGATLYFCAPLVARVITEGLTDKA